MLFVIEGLTMYLTAAQVGQMLKIIRDNFDNAYVIMECLCPKFVNKEKIEKSTEKIDGAVATIMGLDRAIRCGNKTGASVYDDRGILFL